MQLLLYNTNRLCIIFLLSKIEIVLLYTLLAAPTTVDNNLEKRIKTRVT